MSGAVDGEQKEEIPENENVEKTTETTAEEQAKAENVGETPVEETAITETTAPQELTAPIEKTDEPVGDEGVEAKGAEIETEKDTEKDDVTETKVEGVEQETVQDKPSVIKEETKEKKSEKGKKKEEKKKKKEKKSETKEDAEKAADAAEKKTGKKEKKKAKVTVVVPEDEADEDKDQIKKKKKKGKKDKSVRSKVVIQNPSSIDAPKRVGIEPSSLRMGKSKSIDLNAPLQSLMYLRQKSSVVFESSSSSSASILSEFDSKKKKRKGKSKGVELDDVAAKEKETTATEGSPSTDADEAKKKRKRAKPKKGQKGKKGENLVETVKEEEPPRLVPPFVPIPKEPEQPEGEDEGAKKPERKPKKPKGPKLSDKERRKLEQQRAEEARLQAELEAEREAEEERLRLERERKAAVEKEKREIAEQSLRVDQLQNCIGAVRSLIEYNRLEDLKEKETMEWERYLKCDGLPDVSNCAAMNTYLHLWENELQESTWSMDKAASKTDEVIKLLDELDGFIDRPIGVTDEKVADWKWIRSLFRDLQESSMNGAIYKLLRDINNNLNRIDIPTADYRREENNFGLCLWVMVKLPTPLYNPRAPPKPRIEVDFKELKANVLYPASIDCNSMAISAIYYKYDHLSDTCPHYDDHSCPDTFQIDLNEYTYLEWDKKLRYKYERRIRRELVAVDPESDEPPPPPEPEADTFSIGAVPIVKYQKLEPTASQYVIAIEDELSDQIRLSMLTDVPSNVINLRKYLILGGIYKFNLYYQPPQPREMVTYETVLTVLQIPKCLREVPFRVVYEPPPQSLASTTSLPTGQPETQRKTPEEIEAEMKRQEMELDKLMLITLELPQHVMWFDLPTVGRWDPSTKTWTTDDVHDLRHVEEKGYLTFRTGVFGHFGLASYRYGNLPFQAWEIKPENDGSVTIQLTAAVLMFEFNVKETAIAVTQLQNGPNDALQEHVGVYMNLARLKRVLLHGGVDIFPSHDSFSYIEGTCEKCWPMERHLYYDMARLTPFFNFAWSRWNLLAGRRNVVFQMREFKLNKPKQKPHSLCLVTPLKALYVDCTEVSQTFNDEGVTGMKFYADLMNLVRGTSSMSLKTKIQNPPQRTVRTVADFLLATRIMSLA